GRAVTVNSPLGGTVTTTTISGTPTTTTNDDTTTLTINNATTTTTTKTVGGVAVGAGFQAGDHAVILGGPGNSYSFYDNVTVAADAVVVRSTLGLGVTVGAKSYVADSTVAPGTNIPPGTILINNKVVGKVQW